MGKLASNLQYDLWLIETWIKMNSFKNYKNEKTNVMKNLIRTPIYYFKYSFFTVLILGMIGTSCDLVEEQLRPIIDFVEDIAEIGEGMEDAMTLAEDALTITQTDGSTGYLVGECATVVHDELTNTLTIDLGTEPCTGLNGIARSGKIVIKYEDITDTVGFSYSIDFIDYKIAENQIEGKLTIEKLNRNDANNVEFSEKVEDAKITLSDGQFYKWNSERTREMINGRGTANVRDDVFVINGFFEGEDDEGVVFRTQIERPITFFRECWEQGIIYPSIGRTRFTMTDKPSTLLDWGLGCNKRVNIMQNGNWANIELR